MLRHAQISVLFLALFGCSTAGAQGSGTQPPCPASSGTQASTKAACQLPQLYGPGGLATNGGALVEIGDHSGHFLTSFLTEFNPVNTAVGSQLGALPLASPASGVSILINPATGLVTASTESYGPILSERAKTIGRHRILLGFSYQYFNFTTIDGLNLNNLPTIYTHQDDSVDSGTPGLTCSINGSAAQNTGRCSFVRDEIVARNSISLTENQYTAYATFGLTSRIDVSVAIPIVNVNMSATSVATIIPNATIHLHQFPGTVSPGVSCGIAELRANPLPAVCANHTFSVSKGATGIGDVVFRVKGTVWNGERAGVALGLDVRTPTGDALNFLGAGTIGVRPFVVFSYDSRISPHVNFGGEFNGRSVLAGDLTTGADGQLPNQLFYSGGVSFLVVPRRLSATADLIGQKLFKAPRIESTSFTDLGACNDAACSSSQPAQTFPNIKPITGTLTMTSAALGAKLRLVQHLQLTGNVLLRLDSGGLRARAVPLAGLSYSF